MSADKNHVMYVSDVLTFGAWERNATGFAPFYVDADLRDATWAGELVEADATFAPTNAEALVVTIDALGNFTSTFAQTDLAPLTLFDGARGEYRGDYVDPTPPSEKGTLIVLMTPDKAFIGVFSCANGGTFPADCRFAGLAR